MKKVLFIYPSKNPLYVHMLNNIDFSKIDASFITQQSSQEKVPIDKRVHVSEVQLRSPLSTFINTHFPFEVPVMYKIKNMHKILSSIQPDTVVVTDYYAGYFWKLLAYAKKHPLNIILFSETQKLPRQNYRKLLAQRLLTKVKDNLKSVSGIVAFTKSGAQFLEKTLDTPVDLVAPPVDTKVWFPPKKRNKPGKTLKVLVVARFSPYKNHFDVVKAIGNLTKQGVDIQATFVGEGLYKKNVAALIEKYNLQSSINIVSPTGSIGLREKYWSHDVLVLASRNDAIGMVIPEAMACGLPTITSDTIGANTYVVANETGFIYPTGDVQALSETLLRFKQADHKKMSLACTQHINKHFTPSIIGKKLTKIIT